MKIWHILLLIFLLGCERVSQWPVDSRDLDLIVVEGMITNELKSHTVKISRPVKQLNELPEPVNGAVVAVKAGNDIYVFNEDPAGSGIYRSDPFQAVVDKEYLLYISSGSKEYFATAEMVPAANMKPLKYRLVSEESGLYEIAFQESSDASKKEYWISWGHVPGYEDLPVGQTLAHTWFYTLKTIDVNQFFSPDKGRIYFPAGTYILRKKYSLSAAHQAFLRTFLSETEWRGSIFDVQKGNVLTNLSDGAVGFFAVSTVITDTTVVMP